MPSTRKLEEIGLSCGQRNWLLVAFWLPLSLVLLVDIAGHFHEPAAVFPRFDSRKATRPKQARTLTAQSGDLIRVAGVPFVGRRFSQRTTLVSTRNDEGFLDIDSRLTRDPDVVFCGASFLTHGSKNSKTFTARVRAQGKLVIQNRARAGLGPTASITEYLLNPSVVSMKTKVVVWCLIERLLTRRRLRDLSLIDLSKSHMANMEALKAARRSKRKAAYLSRVETYFVETSESRKRLLNLNDLIPPTCLDRAPFSPCSLFELEGRADRPIAYLRASLLVHQRAFKPSEGEALLNGILKVKALAYAENKRLLILLVPDKFTIYGDRSKPVLTLPIVQTLLPQTGRLEIVVAGLKRRGIAVVNLTSVLLAGATSIEPEDMLYHPEDTHWNDKGIAIGATEVAKKLETMLKVGR